MKLKISCATPAERMARWEKIKQGGVWRFVLLRGVLGWGLSMGIIGILFEHVAWKKEALSWYFIVGTCLIAGSFWGLATWFLSMRIYSRAKSA